jgi:hypothetical protein
MSNERSCWWRKATADKWRGGSLLTWLMDNEGDPVAIVEDQETGLCHVVYVVGVCFAAIPPGEVEKKTR